MVQLLPHHQFVIQTPEPLQTVMARLESQTEPPKQFRWTFAKHAPYEGTISASGFTLRRIPVNSRNSLVPDIKGHFQTSAGGTQVHITMRLHPALFIFLGVWSFIWYSACLLMWLSKAMEGQWLLLFAGMPVVIPIGFWLGFWLEVERSRDDLIKMLLGRLPHSTQNRRLVLRTLMAAIVMLSNLWFLGLIINRPAQQFPFWQRPEAPSQLRR